MNIRSGIESFFSAVANIYPLYRRTNTLFRDYAAVAAMQAILSKNEITLHSPEDAEMLAKASMIVAEYLDRERQREENNDQR